MKDKNLIRQKDKKNQEEFKMDTQIKHAKIQKLFKCKIIKINYKTDLKLILEINIWDQTNIITRNKL